MAISVAPVTAKRVLCYTIQPNPYLYTANQADLVAFLNASRGAGIAIGLDGTHGLNSQWTQTWLENLCESMRTANDNYPSALPCTIAPVFIQNGSWTFDGSGNITSPTPAEYDTLMGQFQTGLATANLGKTGTDVITVSDVIMFLEPNNESDPQRRFYLSVDERVGLQVWQNALYTKAKTRWPSAHVSMQACGVQYGSAINPDGPTELGNSTPNNEEFDSPGEFPPMVASGGYPGQFHDEYTPLHIRMPDIPVAPDGGLVAGWARSKVQRTTFGAKQICPYTMCGISFPEGAPFSYQYDWTGSTAPANCAATLAQQAAIYRDDPLCDTVILFPQLYTTYATQAAYEDGLSAFFTEFHTAQNQAPTAVITVTPSDSVHFGTAFTFDGTLSSDPEDDPSDLEYEWDFGDGSPAEDGQVEAHTYATTGEFTVTLTVTDTDDNSHTDYQVVTVTNTAPIAVITVAGTTAYEDVSLNFGGSHSSDPDGDTITYLWAFGDGTTATTRNARKTYNNPGTYTVTLTVSDGADTGVDTVVMTILPTPPAGSQNPPPPGTIRPASQWTKWSRQPAAMPRVLIANTDWVEKELGGQEQPNES